MQDHCGAGARAARSRAPGWRRARAAPYFTPSTPQHSPSFTAGPGRRSGSFHKFGENLEGAPRTRYAAARPGGAKAINEGAGGGPPRPRRCERGAGAGRHGGGGGRRRGRLLLGASPPGRAGGKKRDQRRRQRQGACPEDSGSGRNSDGKRQKSALIRTPPVPRGAKPPGPRPDRAMNRGAADARIAAPDGWTAAPRTIERRAGSVERGAR
jgi:hypothetical protein